jgi:hypothetical protein
MHFCSTTSLAARIKGLLRLQYDTLKAEKPDPEYNIKIHIEELELDVGIPWCFSTIQTYRHCA